MFKNKNSVKMQKILCHHASKRLRTGFAQSTLMQEYDKAGKKYY